MSDETLDSSQPINSDTNISIQEFVKTPGISIESPLLTGADLFRLNVNSLPTLIEPIIPKTGIWALVGSSDTGKSMLLRQLAICLARNSDFLNFKINSTFGKAIYIASEDDEISTSYLLKKQAGYAEDLENIRFHFGTENIISYLKEQLTNEKADLIIIDCWSDIFGQNLNDSALIRQTLNQYRAIANDFNCSIGFLHHTGKRTEKLEPSKNNILSGQGFEAKMRLVMELRSDLKDENKKHLCIVKGNYLGKEFKNSSYELAFDTNTILFSNTGQRIPFEQLYSPGEASQKKKRVQPHEIHNETHEYILSKVFKSKPHLKLSELNPKLSNHYEQQCNDGFIFGKDRVAKFLSHLIENELIFKHGNDRSPVAYYSLSNND